MWAAVGWNSLICHPLGELCDVSHAMKGGTEADGAIDGSTTVLCLAGMEDFSAQEQQLQLHYVNAPGLHCITHGWFRILFSMSLPSSLLFLGILSSIIFG